MSAQDLLNIQRLVHRAICDPGSFLPRGREVRDGENVHESVTHWGMRAVFAAIEQHPDTEIRSPHPTQDSYDATFRALADAEAKVDRLQGLIDGGAA